MGGGEGSGQYKDGRYAALLQAVERQLFYAGEVAAEHYGVGWQLVNP